MDLIDNLLPSGPRQSLTLKEHNINVILTLAKTYLEPLQTLKLVLFAKIVAVLSH